MSNMDFMDVVLYVIRTAWVFVPVLRFGQVLFMPLNRQSIKEFYERPKRIDRVLEVIRTCWLLVPDWRFGQLIFNVLDLRHIDPFFLEEDEVIKAFEKYFELNKK